MAGRKPTVQDQEILEVFLELSDPALTAGEVAAHLPIKKDGTYKRLQELEDEGLVASKKFGPGKGWWLTETGRQYLAGKLDAEDESIDQ